ncbi:hypothetical protein ABZ569_16765 [Streptomyces albus]|uniref:hypothetical protein n=1 Tax=Streptomyces albus TaxID=1888 RepID=UPI0033D883CA
MSTTLGTRGQNGRTCVPQTVQAPYPHCATVRRGENFGNAHHARRAVESMVTLHAGPPGRTPGADVEELRRPLPDDLAGPQA